MKKRIILTLIIFVLAILFFYPANYQRCLQILVPPDSDQDVCGGYEYTEFISITTFSKKYQSFLRQTDLRYLLVEIVASYLIAEVLLRIFRRKQNAR